MARSFWSLSRHEVRAHAIILAIALWAIAAVGMAWPGQTDPFGKIKFPDFVHFYVLGDIASSGEFNQLYDADAQYQRQVALVPASSSQRFVPVYGPQAALIFAPLSRLPYGFAAFCWAALTIVVYGLCVRAAWRSVAASIPDWSLVVFGAAAFPPFWNLVLYGQTTLVPLAAFTLAWMALQRRRRFLAGLAFGLLVLKPQFGLVLAATAVICGEWALVAGATISIAVQMTGVALITGPQPLVEYFQVLARLPQIAADLEPKSYQLHSLRPVAALLPGPAGIALYLLAFATVTWFTSRVWRTTLPVSVRLSTVMLATCLVSPHLTIYDVTVLALPLIWIGGWVAGTQPPLLRDRYWPLVYAFFVVTLVPLAFVIKLQLSVVVQAILLVLVVKSRSGAAAGRPSPAVRSL